MSDESNAAPESSVDVSQPIIIDLGKQKKRRIKKLKRGEGKLWEEVIEVIDEVKAQLGEQVEGNTMVPIIMVYEKKDKRSQIPFPFR